MICPQCNAADENVCVGAPGEACFLMTLRKTGVCVLSGDEVRVILDWCDAADFESRVERSELPLVDKLAKAVGEQPVEHATWARRA